MTMLANLPLFILFYAMSPLWAKAAIYTGITIGIAKAMYLLYYAADLRSRTTIIWGVVIWLLFATASPCGWMPTWRKCTSIEPSARAWHPTLKTPLMRGFGVGHALERVHSLRSRTPKKAKATICRLVLNLRSPFFQSRLFFSNQEKLRSTTHRFGNTAKRCNSFRLTISTSAPINSCTDEANALPV